MEIICGNSEPFWDSNLAWHTEYPNLTPCFEQTVLTWIPSAFLWLISSFHLYSLFQLHNISPSQRLPITPLIILKSLGSLILIIIHLTNLSVICLSHHNQNDYSLSPAKRYSSIIKICTYLLSFFLLLLHKSKGVRTSGLLFSFWLLSSICEVFPFQSVFRQGHHDNQFNFYIQLVNYPIVVTMLILNCWADKSSSSLKPPTSPDHKDKENGIPLISPTINFNPPTERIPCPEADSSYLSKLIFFWFESLAWKGWKNPLVYKDLWELNPQDLSEFQYPLFAKNWENAQLKAKLYGKPFKSVSVFKCLVKTFGPQFFTAACLKFIQDCLTFVRPQILRLLIRHVRNFKDEESWKGYLYVAILLVTSLIQTILLAQYFQRIFLIGMRIRTSLISAIYRKSLKISNCAKKECSSGEVVNLMSVDSQRLMDLVTYLNMVWSSPFQVIVAFYFLWETLGPSVLAGVGVMVVMVPLNGWLVGRVKGFNVKLMKNKDKRVKLISEILAGIKVIKLYAWEPSFRDQVLKIRGQEIKVLRKAECFDAVTTFIWMCAPVLVSLVTFATYVLIDEKNVLDSAKAFVALNLFDIMSIPLVLLPMSMLMIAESSVSLKRLGRYLNADEIDEDCTEKQTNEEYPVIVEDGQFAWDSNTNALHPPTHILKNINLKVKQGSLVAIVGTVGSGKSSLLSAILGEMVKMRGRISVIKGQIAYVAQQAWIRNSSLKDNILFGQEFQSRKYKRIINCCQLAPDLEILPSGDQTEIGEKGVNLSGGQKQRVSLARAVYSDANLYLLDDPLSAVDSHVGREIFDKVLGRDGILKGKTRVLVTHGVTYLHQVDHIIVLKDGQISEEGTYKELLEREGAFSEFLQEYGQEGHNDKQDDKLEKEKQERRRTMSVSSGNTDEGPPIPGNQLIEVEKTETGSVKRNVYKHYFRVIGGPMMIAIFFSHLISQGFQVAGNVWLSKWSEERIREDGTIDPGRRNMYLGIYAAFGAGQSIAVVVGAIVVAISMLKASAKMHNSMLINILKCPSAFFDTTPLGRIVNRFAKDVDVVDKQLPLNLKQWLRCLFQVVGIICVISYSTPVFLAVVVPLGITYLLVQRFYVATSRQLKRLESVSRSPIYSHFSETLAGTSTIRAYSKQLQFILESEAKVDYNQRAYFPSIVANRWLAVRLETIGNLIIFFAGLFGILGRDHLDAGTVGLSVSYATTITPILNWLVRMTADVETNIVAVERLKEYSEVDQEAEWEIVERKPPPNWPQNGGIIFDRYQTRYRPGLNLVLKNVTCQIKPGEKVGIVGRTGAGKSSLTLALFRLVEGVGGGRIIIDGINIGLLGLHDLRNQLTIIPQEPVLFSGTLRFNLDPFGKHSDTEIWNVLGLAHLKNFVMGLASGGLGYEISEGGENLSVGQRQLVCLARALLRKTKILVMDEATAAVDLETDDLIQGTIRSAFRECTVLTIAHRLNTVMDCMRVMVLDKGEIKEFESVDSLLENRKSIFYGMAKDAGIVS